MKLDWDKISHTLLLLLAVMKTAQAMKRGDPKMGEKLGIQETKDVLALVLDAANIVGEAKKNDGKIDITDAALLIKLVPELAPAFAGITAVPAELGDLDEAEATELVAFVAAKFTLGDPHAREVVEAGLKAVSAVWHLIVVLKK